jgi:hypothetical protein
MYKSESPVPDARNLCICENARGGDRLGACGHCGRRILTDDRYHKAIALATANEGWIEKVFWCEHADSLVSLVIVLVVDLPLTTLKFAGPVGVLLSLSLLPGDRVLAKPGMPFHTWLLIPATVLAADLILRFIKSAIERWFLPVQFAAKADFIVSNGGIVISSQGPEPFLLPWFAISNCTWFSDVGSMTSQITLEYLTAANNVARVTLQGEERTQPLGELFDIVEARCKRQAEG